jgi:hypothetical protein
LAIRRLETLGLVKRSRDPADLRLVLGGWPATRIRLDVTAGRKLDGEEREIFVG